MGLTRNAIIIILPVKEISDATVFDVIRDAAGRPSRSGNPQRQTAAPRRLHPPEWQRHLCLLAPDVARPEKSIPNCPRRDGRHRRTRMPPPPAATVRLVARVRSLGHLH